MSHLLPLQALFEQQRKADMAACDQAAAFITDQLVVMPSVAASLVRHTQTQFSNVWKGQQQLVKEGYLGLLAAASQLAKMA